MSIAGNVGGFDEALFVTFNQDATSLAVGSKRGYKLFPLNQLDELKPLHEFALEDVCLVERLYSSSLVTLVTLTAPRKLQVCHFQKGQEICSQSYSNTILAVRLNRLRLVVCLEESLYIHNIRDMKMLHTIRDTPPNPQGLCELTSSDISYLAYPGSSTIGEVQIFDSANLQAVTMIAAHNSPLAALKFNSDGTKLATASDKGTVIRVFAVPSGEKLFEFRRGMKRCVTIYSLAFSADSLFLCSSSNTETVHVFKLEHHHDKETKSKVVPEEQASSGGVQGWMNFVSKTAASYLPSQVSEIFHQDRAFAHAKLAQPGAHNVCALTVVKQQPRLLVASLDGYFYVYALDKMEGGECVLLKQHKLIPSGGSGSGGVASSPNAVATQVVTGGTSTTATSPSGGGITNATAPASGRSGSTSGGIGGNSGTGAGGPKSASHPQPQTRETSPSSFVISKSYASATVQSQAESSTEQRLKRLVDTAQPAFAGDDGLKLDDSREFPPMTHSPD